MNPVAPVTKTRMMRSLLMARPVVPGRYFQGARDDRAASKTCSGLGHTFQASPQLILIY
jgi:hypothetical protein